MARQINSYLGGFVVAPWEVDDLDDEWKEAIDAMIHKLPTIQAGKAKVEAHLRRWRNKHPGYRRRN
jgi:hypothetical protein